MNQSTSSVSQREFAQLFQRSQRRAYNLAYRLTGNADDAEDITQDAYVRAWHKFDSYDASRCFESWLFGILTHRVIDLHRRNRVATLSLDAPMLVDDSGESLLHQFASGDSDPGQIIVGPILSSVPLRSLIAFLRVAQ